MKSATILAAAALALVSAAGLSAAQPAKGAEPPQRSGMPNMEVPPVNGEAEEFSGRVPVLHVTSVEIMRSTHAPAMDIVRVRGVASSYGWGTPELVPLTRGIPADGMLQLLFVARAPEQASDASHFETVEAIFPLEPQHPFKGVNVHSASEAIAVMTLPGYAEGKPPGDDCGKCVGQLFVAKGARVPAGRAGVDYVREEQLPAALRVIRPADGIPLVDSNPNRLTLLLDQEGRITLAVWE